MPCAPVRLALGGSRSSRRLRIYGRTYRAVPGAQDSTAAAVEARCTATPRPGVLEPVISFWSPVMPWDHPTMPGEKTLMGVCLDIAPDRYRAYGIVGGP